MKLKISKLLLESALIFQARNDVRYYLNGICFMPDETKNQQIIT
nr:MAG TPA: DNA polymerase III, beta subunit [Caudoviricetes sp.]